MRLLIRTGSLRASFIPFTPVAALAINADCYGQLFSAYTGHIRERARRTVGPTLQVEEIHRRKRCGDCCCLERQDGQKSARRAGYPLDCEKCHDWYLRNEEKLKDVCGGALVGLAGSGHAYQSDVAKYQGQRGNGHCQGQK
ncbi:MAG: hypothetical protein ABI082_04210, partial [Dokdonella sp.]